MKKIILTALNSRHTHSALALAYLQSYWQSNPDRTALQIVEFDLNQTNEGIIAELILQKPDIIAFSVYIWSISRTLVIAGALKSALPDIKIILGGPEVSFNASAIMHASHYIDCIVRGEGEESFTELLEALLHNCSIAQIAGVTYRDYDQIRENPAREFIKNLDIIPSPFQNGFYKDVHSFTYYEASRGCPSSCSYCLSSVLGPVRNHSIERVKDDLDWFFASNYSQVRFSDRTFNFDRPRAKEIIQYIKEHNKRNINFHFEIQADFLSEDIIDLLADSPEGMFHLEIGIQSTNPAALTSVNRRFNLEILQDRIKKLKSRTRCHLHLDLLGGLPQDTLEDFFRSLDDVWKFEAHSIQISLVKVLRGTPLEASLADGHIFAMPDPPYTILRTSWLNSHEAVRIQDIGKLVEGLHNCQRFPASLKYMVYELFSGSAARFFNALSDFWRKHKLLFFSFGPDVIAQRLKDFSADLNDLNIAAANSLQTQIFNLLEHELRMAQKVPGGPPGPSPTFAASLSRHKYRPDQGLKAYWYDYNPLDLIRNAKLSCTGPFPLVYSFSRDKYGAPTVEALDLSLPEAFTIAAVQQRIPVDTLADTWHSTYERLPVPYFTETIEKLCQKGLLYEPAKKRSKPDENASKSEFI